jgi:hypothetical protein
VNVLFKTFCECFESVLNEKVVITFWLRTFFERFQNFLWIFWERFVYVLRIFSERFVNVFWIFQNVLWTFCESFQNVLWISLESSWRDLSNDTSHDRVLNWPYKRLCRSYNGQRVHKSCIVGKPSNTPFQRYLIWRGYVFKIYMTFGRWPWRNRPISLKKQTWTLSGPLMLNAENRIRKYWRVEEICALTQTDWRTDGRTDGLVIPIKGFHPLINYPTLFT